MSFQHNRPLWHRRHTTTVTNRCSQTTGRQHFPEGHLGGAKTAHVDRHGARRSTQDHIPRYGTRRSTLAPTNTNVGSGSGNLEWWGPVNPRRLLGTMYPLRIDYSIDDFRRESKSFWLFVARRASFQNQPPSTIRASGVFLAFTPSARPPFFVCGRFFSEKNKR